MHTINSEEYLARYIFSAKHISIKDSRIKPAAFLPRANTRKISVFRISRLTEVEIWEMGNSIALGRSNSLKGRADFQATCVFENNMSMEIDEPPLHHVNILLPEKESEQKLAAMKLAKNARLVLANS